ncbi:Uncharacterised protein [Candidatus Anstonella stagnisolia]|nr:Uncharacterised protein [Candidatus Anstonella stagnisolia]
MEWIKHVDLNNEVGYLCEHRQRHVANHKSAPHAECDGCCKRDDFPLKKRFTIMDNPVANASEERCGQP